MIEVLEREDDEEEEEIITQIPWEFVKIHLKYVEMNMHAYIQTYNARS